MDEGTAKQGGFFYGWWIVAGGFLIMATCYTIFVNCIPLFQAHVVADLEISMAEFNAGVAFCTVVAIFASLLLGMFVEKISSRLMGSITVIVAAIVLLFFSFITQLWQLYVLCIVAGMIVVAGTRLLVSVLTTNWFTTQRGLAVAIALSGSGFGGVLLTKLTTWVIGAYTWRMAFLLLAIVCLIVALPLALIVFRNRPSDKGLLPYGSAPHEQAAEAQKAQQKKLADAPVTIAVGWKALRRSTGFWLLIGGLVCMGIVNGAIITNSVTNMTSVTLQGEEIITGGHTIDWASNVWSLYLGVVIVAKVFLGFIYDRWGLKAGTIIGTATCAIASVALCFPTTSAGPIIAAVAFGFGTCMGTVTPPVMVVKEFGKKDLGLVVGIATAFELFGAAIGAVLSGNLFDMFLTYQPAWLMSLGASLAMGVLLMLSIPAALKLVEKRRAAGAPELDAEGFELPVAQPVETPIQ